MGQIEVEEATIASTHDNTEQQSLRTRPRIPTEQEMIGWTTPEQLFSYLKSEFPDSFDPEDYHKLAKLKISGMAVLENTLEHWRTDCGLKLGTAQIFAYLKRKITEKSVLDKRSVALVFFLFFFSRNSSNTRHGDHRYASKETAI
jgi:hypothetical protein